MPKYSKEENFNPYNSTHDDYDPFQNDDFNVNMEIKERFGKRTGKLIEPQKWRKNSDGFSDFQIDSNETVTPNSKMKKIRQMFGLSAQESQSSSTSQSSLEQNIPASNNKDRVPANIKNGQMVNKNKERRFSRKTDFQLSFTKELDKEILQLVEKYDTSDDQDLSESDTKSEVEQAFDTQYKNQHKENPNDESFNPKQLYKSKSKKKQSSNQSSKSKERRKQKQFEIQSKITQNQFIKQIKQDKNYQKENYQKSKILKITSIQNSINQNQFNHEEPFEPNVQLGQMPQNFEQKESLKKYFKDLSDIKTNYNLTQQSFSSNQQLKSFLNVIQPSDSETGELNRAIINNQSENIDKDSNQKHSYDLKEQKVKNNKKSNEQSKITNQNKYQKQKNFSKLSSQQDQAKINKNNKNKKQNYFLTESIRKQSALYYEKQQKKVQQKKILQQKISNQVQLKKNSKRQRLFQNVETNDILDYDKIQQQKEKTDHQKAFKKFKVNEPKLQNTQKVNQRGRKNNSLPKIKQNKDKKQNKESKENRKIEKQHQHSIDQHTYQSDEVLDNKEAQQRIENREEQQRIKINNKLVKQVDKKIKRKQRPLRAGPFQKEKIKKSETLNSKLGTNSLKSKQLSRSLTEVKAEEENSKNSSILQTESQLRHKYPKRKRYQRLQFWNGQKILYDSEGNAKTIETKELLKLIGFVNQTLIGQLERQSTLSREDRYVQQATLQPKQTIDFLGFDGRYQALEIDVKKKSKYNMEKLRRSIQIYQDGKLGNLNDFYIIEPDTKGFSIQNIGDSSICIQLNLIKKNKTDD